MKIKLKDASNFKRMLVLNGYTGRKFSERIGLSPVYVSLIVNGKRNLSATVAKKIVDVLQVDFDDIFFIEDAFKSKIDEVRI